MIEARDITVRRAGRAILDQVSLSLPKAGLTAVIGPNGAGKSTLLAVLAGLLAPDSGEVRLGDRPIRQWAPKLLARTRSYLPQNPRCDWPISVERLVALGLIPHLSAFESLPPTAFASIDFALEDSDLVDRRDQPVTTLSGGEFSRAMLARALVGDPALVIVDEPTTGLDPRHALDAMTRLKAQGSVGRLVIASLHDLTLTGRFADTIVALKDGKVIAQGPTSDVLTAELVRTVFDVTARITMTPEGPLIDLVG